MIYLVGLTGLIGSGKSLVGQIFSDLGVKVIDTDIIAHQLTQPKSVGFEAVIAEFGNQYVDCSGYLDRALLRTQVFSNQKQLQRLESILHPLIFKAVMEQVASISDDSKYAVITVPLLFKAPKYLELVNRTLFIDCEIDLLIRRVSERSNLYREQILAILDKQLPRTQQLLMADDVINNVGSIEQLQLQVKLCHNKYLNFATNIANTK